MNIPGMKYLRKAERAGNRAEVPMAEGLGTVDLLKRTAKEVSDDHLMAFAGNLTYKGLFALFPLFTLLLSLLGMFNAEELVDTLTSRLSGVMPESAANFVDNQLTAIVQSQASGTFTFGAIISILLALWGVSGAMRSVMEAMNVMYDIEEGRPFYKKYAISIFITLLVIVLILSALALIVFGQEIGARVAEAVGLGNTFQTVWSIAQWPVLAFFVLLAFALLYYFAPAAEQRWRWISPGSMVAFAFWLLFSLAFSYYVSNFGSYNETYGTLAGIVILMLYFYYSSVIVLVGAEMNQVIEEHIPGGKNKGEKLPDDDPSG